MTPIEAELVEGSGLPLKTVREILEVTQGDSVSCGHQIVGKFKHFESLQTKEYNDSGEMICEIVNGVQTRENSLRKIPN